eukprot:gene14221-biopygen20088
MQMHWSCRGSGIAAVLLRMFANRPRLTIAGSEGMSVGWRRKGAGGRGQGNCPFVPRAYCPEDATSCAAVDLSMGLAPRASGNFQRRTH